jgi:hypothetical protein
MKVLIVAKTHMPGAFCVGGLARDTNHNIRLLEADGLNPPIDTKYEVGTVWELDFRPCEEIWPPHVEDVNVQRKAYLGRVSNIRTTLLERVRVWEGGPETLFEGYLKFSEAGSGYLAAEGPLPSQSVGFWLTNEAFIRRDYQDKTRYMLRHQQLKVTYVGVAPPLEVIPAGTLLRVSLARWWRPKAELEARCYLQLSGWYL